MSKDARLAAGAGLVSQARLVGGALNMLIIVLLTRLLSKEDFAAVALVYLVQETLNAFGPLGLDSALSFFVPKLGPRVSRALGVYTGAVLTALAVPYALVLFFGGPAIAEVVDIPGIETPLAWLALAVLCDFPGQTLPQYFIATERYIGAFWVTLVFYLSRFCSLVIPAWLGADVATLIALFAGVAVLRAAMYLVYFAFIAKGPLRGPEVRGQWRLRDLFEYGLPLSLSLIVGKLNVQLDKYLIAAIAAAEVFAIYSVGATELPLVPGIAYSVTGALVPALVIAHRDGAGSDFVRLWHGSMVKVAAIMMPVFVALFVLAEPTVRLLFSKDYDAAAVPFRVYLCLMPLRLCAYGAVVRALGRTRPVLTASIAALLANAVLNYPFYLAFGLPGPALASIVAQVVAIGLLLQVIRRQLDLSWVHVFPYAAVLRALVVAAVAAVPLLLVDHWVTGDGARIAAGFGVYVPTYVVLGRLGGLLSAADLRYVVDFLTGRLVRRARG